MGVVSETILWQALDLDFCDKFVFDCDVDERPNMLFTWSQANNIMLEVTSLTRSPL